MNREVQAFTPVQRVFMAATVGALAAGIFTGANAISHQDPYAQEYDAGPEPSPLPVPEQESGVAEAGLRDSGLKARAASVISTFENSTTEIRYGYAENIGDGRGITAGRAGFTSGTSDLLEVVSRYAAQRPDSELATYVETLEAVDGTESTEGLEGFVEAWSRTSSEDPLLNEIQDQVTDEWYFDPAMRRAEELGVRSPLGQLIIWDTIIQHGEGNDPDGLPAIQDEVIKQFGLPGDSEAQWLGHFLDERQEHLENADDEVTREAWAESTDRVNALRSMLGAGNMSLNLPLTWAVYGDRFSVDQ